MVSPEQGQLSYLLLLILLYICFYLYCDVLQNGLKQRLSALLISSGLAEMYYEINGCCSHTGGRNPSPA